VQSAGILPQYILTASVRRPIYELTFNRREPHGGEIRRGTCQCISGTLILQLFLGMTFFQRLYLYNFIP
jgi:hypothetical protein